MKAAIAGAAIAIAHVAAFATLASHARGTELAVTLRAPGSRDGDVPAAIADRVRVEREPDAPGLRRTRWRVEYRGGIEREVGATELVGPAQRARGACSGRVVVGQRMLDELAPIATRLVDDELRGTSIFGLGAYEHTSELTLRWARAETHPFDAALLGDGGAPHGYVRAMATIAFERVRVPIVLALIPERAAGRDELRFRVEVHAELAFGNRALQWLSDKLPVDRVASRLAGHELDAMLVTTLAPPPPIELPDGQSLRFTYCDGALEVADGAWGALPFGVAFDAANAIAPPHVAPGPPRPPPANTAIALDLDIDALNALLFELWRTRWLDRRLADAHLDRAFADDPTVAQFLSVRIGAPTLALPPVVEPAGDHLRLAADARVPIRDGDAQTVGRVFGAFELRMPDQIHAAPLELACERGGGDRTALVPCYADLVAGVAARGPDFDATLAREFTALVRAIFADQKLSLDGVPVALAIHGAALSLAPGARGVHVDLDAGLAIPGE